MVCLHVCSDVGGHPTLQRRGIAEQAPGALPGILEFAFPRRIEGVHELEAQLADPELWVEGPERGRALQRDLAEAQARADELYATWERLSTKEEAGS